MEKTEIIDLNFVFKTINAINKTKDFQDVAEIIFNFIEEIVTYNMAVIYKINKNELEVVSARGSNLESMKRRVPLKVGEGAVGWVAKEKKALLINDVLKVEDIKVRQITEDPIIRSFLAVPMVVGDKLIGILSLSCSKPNQYTGNDVDAISIIASQGAALLELNNKITEATRFSNHILESINSGVIVIDKDFKVIVFNKAAEKITGYTREEIIGKKIFDISLKENDGDWYVVESLKTGKTFFEHSSYMVNKSGKYVNIRLSTSLLRNEENEVIGCTCIFRDNTEVERLQQQIIRADKLAAIGRLTSGIAHEIRNPLLPIRTASKFLLDKIGKGNGQEDIVKLLKIINDESERLNRFLDDFVNLSKQDVNVEGECYILETLEETIILVKHSLSKSKINLKKDLPKEDIKLPCNKDRLKQVFINLFLNSIDAIVAVDKDIKEIHVKIEKYDDRCVVTFRDTGCGIKPEDLNHIFDPFYTTKENGTGLGLSIMYNIIRTLNGDISVESKEGEWTEFTLIFPLYK